jgi:DNA-binding CsgD family transcriptional regulator
MNKAEELSTLLLDLYAHCHEKPMSEFLPHALGKVRALLPFDSAWWAMTTMIGDKHDIHASYVQGLPEDMHTLWLSIQDEDVIGHALMRQHPGKTLNFTPQQVDSTPGSRWLAHRTGFRHVLCTQMHNATIGQQTFLALSRHDDAHSFSEDERHFKELLMPHLHAMINMNWVANLRQMSATGSDRRNAMAIVDKYGAVHALEPGFTALLKNEWPDWDGPCVPQPILQAILRKEGTFAGAHINAALSWQDALVLLELKPRSPLELLTIRERTVVEAFAAGESYKEVARTLGMAPATVRHHLRSAYAKLNVTNKAEITKMVSTTSGVATGTG